MQFSVSVACVEAFAFVTGEILALVLLGVKDCLSMPYCCSERESARNLMDYLAIRREDLREIQVRLDVSNGGQH